MNKPFIPSLTRHAATVTTCLLLVQCGVHSALGMAASDHLDLAAYIQDTPVEEGGLGGMTWERMESINRWMDEPSTRTGEYINQATETAVHPTNHGHLRHNPEAAARVYSGVGETDPAARNFARLHKIADISHNSAPVDGYEITQTLQEEAQSIVHHVKQHRALPNRLPSWVDDCGPTLAKASKMGTGVGKADSAVSKMVTKGFGAAMVVGGAIQVVDGIETIRQADTVEGACNTAEGMLNAGAGASLLACNVPLATGLAGGACVVDGGCTVYKGIQSDNTEQIVVGGVKTLGGAVMIAGAATVQPEVVVGGAVVYGGGVVYENWDGMARETSNIAQQAAHMASSAADTTSDYASDAARSASIYAHRATSVAQDMAANGYDQTRSWVQDAGTHATVLSSQARDVASQTWDGASTYVGDQLRRWMP